LHQNVDEYYEKSLVIVDMRIIGAKD